MDWDDKPGLPRLVIPVGFGVFPARLGQKNPKRTGMTSLGSPGVSSQSVSGFLRPFSTKKTRNGQTGMTRLGFPGLSSQSVSGFSWPFTTATTTTTGGLGEGRFHTTHTHAGPSWGGLGELYIPIPIPGEVPRIGSCIVPSNELSHRLLSRTSLPSRISKEGEA